MFTSLITRIHTCTFRLAALYLVRLLSITALFPFCTEQLDAAYERALKEGYEEVFLARLNLVGFHEAGKTSLAKRLLGEEFDPGEESTEGIALHYIKSTFNKDTQRGASWNKVDISAYDLHRGVMKNVVSQLEPTDPEDIVNKEDITTESVDDNQGQEYVNSKTTHEEDSHSDDRQDETAPPGEKQEVQEESMAEREMSEPIQPTMVIRKERQVQETKHIDMNIDTDKKRSQVANEESTEKQNRGAHNTVVNRFWPSPSCVTFRSRRKVRHSP